MLQLWFYSSQCFESTLVAYHFNPTDHYPIYCYPRAFKPQQGQESEEDVNPEKFGNIRNEEEAWDYSMTLEPKFYTEQARQTFFEETYAERQREKEEEARRQAEAEMDASDFEYDVNPNPVNPEDYELVDAETFHTMLEEQMREATTRDYGPPAAQKWLTSARLPMRKNHSTRRT